MLADGALRTKVAFSLTRIYHSEGVHVDASDLASLWNK